MKNLTRRGAVGVFGAALLSGTAFAQSANPPSPIAQSQTQAETALEYIQANYMGRVSLMLDKVNSELYLINENGRHYKISVIHGAKNADDLDASDPGDVTVAGTSGVNIAFNPSLDEGEYVNQVTLNFLEGPNTTLSLHSMLGLNSEEGKKTWGCIRIPRDQFEMVTHFVLQAGRGSERADILNDYYSYIEAQQQLPLLERNYKEFDTTVNIFVLPEVDTSRENTLLALQKPMNCGFDTFKNGGAEACPAATLDNVR